MPKGRYFFIRNPASGLVLELPEAAADGACSVQIGYQISSSSCNEHQLWYLDIATGTIRNKANSLCMDISNATGTILVNPYHTKSFTQLWDWSDKRLRLRDDYESVVSISSESAEPGCDVISAEDGGRPEQQWEFVYTEPLLFYIVNSHTNHVMDVARGHVTPGAKVIVWPRSEPHRNNQLWYQDEHGFIHSRLNDFVLTEQDGDIVMRLYDPVDSCQKWTIRGNRIVHAMATSRVLDTKIPSAFKVVSRMTKVIASERADVASQEWFFEYLADQDVAYSHPGTGKLALITCFQHPNLALTLANGGRKPGNPVVLAAPCQGNSGGSCPNQLWYQDDFAGTVRCAANDYCLDVSEQKGVVNPHDHQAQTQKWRYTYDDQKFHYRYHYVRVFQVHGNLAPSSTIITAINNDIPTQKFIMNHVPADHVYIKNNSTGKVMEVRDGNADAGAAVVLATQQPGCPRRQLWYEDERGLIRSVLNGYVFSAEERSYLQMMPLNPSVTSHQWIFNGDRIQNRCHRNSVADIYKNSKADGARICAWAHHGEGNQRWRMELATPKRPEEESFVHICSCQSNTA